MSPNPPDHPDHTPGINAPYGGASDDPSAHVGQTANVAGSLGVVHAIVNGNPALVANLKKADAEGATNDVNFARYIIGINGGVKGIAAKLAEPSPLEQEYGFVKQAVSDAHPEWTDAQVKAEALARVKPDPMAPHILAAQTQVQVAGMQESAASARQTQAEKYGLPEQQAHIEESHANVEEKKAIAKWRTAQAAAANGTYTDGTNFYVQVSPGVFADPATGAIGNPNPATLHLLPKTAGGAGGIDHDLTPHLEQDSHGNWTRTYHFVRGADGKTYKEYVNEDPANAPPVAPSDTSLLPHMTPGTQKEHDALRPGMLYVDPHGNVRNKPKPPSSAKGRSVPAPAVSGGGPLSTRIRTLPPEVQGDTGTVVDQYGIPPLPPPPSN